MSGGHFVAHPRHLEWTRRTPRARKSPRRRASPGFPNSSSGSSAFRAPTACRRGPWERSPLNASLRVDRVWAACAIEVLHEHLVIDSLDQFKRVLGCIGKRRSRLTASPEISSSPLVVRALDFSGFSFDSNYVIQAGFICQEKGAENGRLIKSLRAEDRYHAVVGSFELR